MTRIVLVPTEEGLGGGHAGAQPAWSLLVLRTAFTILAMTILHSTEATNLVLRHIARDDLRHDGMIDWLGAVSAQTNVFFARSDWNRFWTTNHVRPPEVDFSTNIAAVVFAGEKPNPGHGVEIKAVLFNASDRSLVLRLTEWLPNPERGYIQSVEYPVDVVILRKPPRVQRIVVVREAEVRPP